VEEAKHLGNEHTGGSCSPGALHPAKALGIRGSGIFEKEKVPSKYLTGIQG